MGYCKKDATPLLTHWSTSFLHLVIHIRGVICWLPPPHPLLFPSMQWNQYDNALIFFNFFHSSMYWPSSITLYCTATYREYRIETVEFAIHNHFQYLHWLLKSSGRCPVTQWWSLDMSLILFCSSIAVLWLSHDGGDGQVCNPWHMESI